MAVRKWPKWVVGISSVLSFTGFLYVTQSQQDLAKSYALDANANEAAQSGTVADTTNTQSSVQTPKTNAKLYLHNVEEMEEVHGMSDDEKSEREKQLEGLNWESDPGAEITLPAPNSQVTQSTPAVQNTQPTTTTPKSTRSTRRS